jgi:hypothetical protein
MEQHDVTKILHNVARLFCLPILAAGIVSAHDPGIFPQAGTGQLSPAI